MADNGSSRAPRRYPSIRSLNGKAQSILEETNVHISMKSLLLKIQEHQQASTRYLEFNRPDLAFVHHIVAMDLLVNRIPQNQEFPTFTTKKGDLWTLSRALQTKLSAQQDEFDQVKIKLQTLSGPDVNTSSQVREEPSSAPTHEGLSRNGALKRKPAIVPKPKGLQSKPVNDLSNRTQTTSQVAEPSHDLKDRFACLGGPSSKEIPRDDGQVLRMPSPSDYHVRRDNTSFLDLDESASLSDSQPSQTNGNRPKGPREMPKANGLPPPFPPKISLQASISMPRPPSPAYSPAHSVMQPGPVVSNGNASSINSAQVFQSPPSHLTSSMNDQEGAVVPSVAVPESGLVHAQELHKLLRQKMRLLLIDVRERSKYDEGHIYSQSIICVDPVCLREGMSAIELEEALVLSPESEQTAFVRRASFDCVIIYDQRSIGVDESRQSWKGQPPSGQSYLRIVKDALDNYSYNEPLKSHVVLLHGGLEAWIDYAGLQALSASRTQNLGPTSPLELRYRPTATEDVDFTLSNSHSSLPHRRRLAEVETSKENQLKLARRQAAVVPIDDFNDASINQNLDDFFHRFPAVSDIPESMTASSSVSHVQRAPTILTYSSQRDSEFSPSSSRMSLHATPPTVPSRPAPTLPRTSYSGVSTPGSMLVRANPRPRFFRPDYTIPQSLIGLVNPYQTCYLNSIVQCLSATAPLSGWMMAAEFNTVFRQISQSSQSSEEGETKKQRKEDLKKRKICIEFILLIRALHTGGADGKGRDITPTKFKTALSNLYPMYVGTNQQDAVELYSHTMEAIFDTMNMRNSGAVMVSDKQKERSNAMPIHLDSRLQFFMNQGHRGSYAEDIFGMQTVSRRNCKNCNVEKREWLYENHLVVNLPGETVKTATLEDLLREKAKKNDLEMSCDVKSCGSKEFFSKWHISRAPRILVINLVRGGSLNIMDKTGRMLSRTFKLQTVVQYPLDALDMTEYFLDPLPPMTSNFKQELNRHYPDAVALMQEPEPASTGPFLYELYAIVLHAGETLQSGHYYSYIRGERKNEWWEYNDTTIVRLTRDKYEELNRNRRAVALFYRRSNLL